MGKLAGTNPIFGTNGTDTITGTSGNDAIDARGGDDFIYGLAGDDVIFGGDDDDLLDGGLDSDDLDGGSGDDRLQGGGGNDTLTGGPGDDTFIFNAGDGADTVTDLESGDNVQIGGYTAAQSITQSGDDVVVVFSASDQITFLNTTVAAVQGALRLPAPSSIDGTPGNDTLVGTSGDDRINGFAGHDSMNGGAGADTMVGALSNDTYYVDNAGDVVTEVASEGIDRVLSSISYTLGGTVETLWLIGAAAISGIGNGLNNIMLGNAAANTLTGGGGHDTLNGGGGADTLIGGVGHDNYVVDNAADVLIEAAGEGIDKVTSIISFVLPDNVEYLTLVGTVAISATGNELNNLLVGNVAANMLTGGVGNDTLNGGGGADTMEGGIGDDAYIVDNSGDVIIEAAGEGVDRVTSSASYTLSDNVENLTLIGTAVSGTGNGIDNTLIGNAAANTLSGGGGNDTLDGRVGADTMSGGIGDDAYFVDNAADTIIEAAGDGVDRVFSSVSYTLADNVENMWLQGAGAISGTGNDSANSIVGNGAANTLTGAAGNDTLTGGGGNDHLRGGGGNDHLRGGDGADSFYFDTALGGNKDAILDFSAADDSIHLDLSVFSDLSGAGALDAAAFRLGTVAADADDRILYDQATGNIYYDADGSGGGAAVQFAQVTAGTLLSEADFFAYA